MSPPRNDIPSIPDSVPADLRRPLARIREEMQALLGFRGSDPAIRSSNAASALGSVIEDLLLPGDGGSGTGEPDLTPPPSPESFTALAGINNVFLSWSGINYTQGHGNKQTLIYGVQKDPDDPTLPVFGDAQLLGTAPHALTFFALTSDPHRRWHLWLKFESVDGIQSVDPTGGVNGVTATTGQDVRRLIDALSQAAEDPLFPYSRFTLRGGLINVADDDGNFSPVFNIVTTPFTQNGVSVPVGVYISDAFIANGTITTAMIGNAMIDDAKVATLSAAKFTGGEMRVGSFLQSTNYTSGASGTGFRIAADGTAELQAAYIRGQLAASQINARGLSILDPAGNVIVNAGATPKISPSVLVDDGSGLTIGNLALRGSVKAQASAYVFLAAGSGTTFTPSNIIVSRVLGGGLTTSNSTTTWAVVTGTLTGSLTVLNTTTGAPPSIEPSEMGTDAVTLRCTVTHTATGQTFTDDITILKSRDAVSGYLDNEAIALVANSSGTIASYSGASGRFRLVNASGEITVSGGNPAFSVTAHSGFTHSFPTLTGISVDSAGNYSVTSNVADGSDLATVTIRATYTDPLGATKTVDRVFKITKAKQGGTGPTGERGTLTGYGTASSWIDTTARDVIWQLLGNAGSAPSNAHLRIPDTVTLSNGTNFAETRFWSGSSWIAPGLVVNGNLLVTGTVGANALAANSVTATKIAAGEVSADKISSSATVTAGGVGFALGNTSVTIGGLSGAALFRSTSNARWGLLVTNESNISGAGGIGAGVINGSSYAGTFVNATDSTFSVHRTVAQLAQNERAGSFRNNVGPGFTSAQSEVWLAETDYAIQIVTGKLRIDGQRNTTSGGGAVTYVNLPTGSGAATQQWLAVTLDGVAGWIPFVPQV